DNRGRCSGVVT
ncbi:hypothetical protein EC960109_1971B, partial [Escherichia coli 96.0109]